MQTETGRVLKQEKIGDDFRILTLSAPRIARKVQPGQFVNLHAAGLADRVLRRPFSVFKTGARSIVILYKIVGAGTAAMARLSPGDRISIIGPLGNGFPLPPAGIFPILVAGGYGGAALYLLAARARRKGLILIGGKTAEEILCANDFRRLGWKTIVATEDGSRGQKGLVTDVLVRCLRNPRIAGLNAKPELYACGPMGMLKAVAHLAQSEGLKAWLSLDRHMGCGVGACLACVQKVRVPGTPDWKWARICTEGPVFECRQILWH